MSLISSCSASFSVLQGDSSGGRGTKYSPRLWTRWQPRTMKAILFDTEQTETPPPPADGCPASTAVQLQRKAGRGACQRGTILHGIEKQNSRSSSSPHTSHLASAVVCWRCPDANYAAWCSFGRARWSHGRFFGLLPWWWLVFTISKCKLETDSPSITARLQSIEWLLLVNISWS